MMLAVAGVGALPVLATPPEPIDADFLDYLASCEGKDDNWTVVANKKERKQAPKPPAAKPPSPVTDAAPAPGVKP